MMNQPKLRKTAIQPPQTEPVRPWAYAPAADEFAPWPIVFEVDPWRP